MLVHQTDRNANIQWLFFIGLFVACLDIVNIDLGGFKLKIAYVVFAGYVLMFSYFFGLNMNKRNAFISTFLLVSFIPSLVFSTNKLASVAFFAGTTACISIMLVFAKMTRILGAKVVDVLLAFYRFSVILTAIFVVVGLQDRGHFLLYEASYYSLALIPYFCIVFCRYFTFGFKAARTDIFFILAAIGLSQSVSMILWAGAAFFLLYFSMGKVRLHQLLLGLLVMFVGGYFSYEFSERGKAIGDLVIATYQEPENSLRLLVFVAGNRVQRILVAYDAFVSHPWVGVGLGALKSYAAAMFHVDSFDIDGISASDFDLEMNATNVFLEVGAEAGIVGLVAYLSLLMYVSKKNQNPNISTPFKVAFYLTMGALLIESSYLRPYVWALYGVIIGLSSIEDADKVSMAFEPRRIIKMPL